jgi:16S rRNA (uracil1498-N3)-methyltransferase
MKRAPNRPLARFYVPMPLVSGEPISLPKSTGHHLARVLRIDEEEQVVLFNGHGGEFQSTVHSISKGDVIVLPEKFIEENRAPALSVHLGMCILKRDAMDAALTKATEVGVTSITPLVSEHATVAKQTITKRSPHWQQVVISACEQCGLNVLPAVQVPTPLVDWVSASRSHVRLMGLPQGTGRMEDAKGALSTNSSDSASDKPEVSLLIGPEGGFSASEIDLGKTNGFTPVTFGSRVLRSETAPIVALSVIHHVWGDY